MKRVSILALFIVSACGLVQAQTTFTYQGKLNDGGVPANGLYDLRFRLFNTPGNQVGTLGVCNGASSNNADAFCDNVQVSNGVFTVDLSFGTSVAISGLGTLLEIAVRPGASTGGYETLNPLLKVNASPFAAYAVNATRLGGLTAGDYVTYSNALNWFILNNSGAQQENASFNIGGNGTLGGLLVYPNSGDSIVNLRNRTTNNFSQVVFTDQFDIYRGYIGYIGPSAPIEEPRRDTVEFGSNSRDMTFRPANIEAIRLKTDGKVGIGTNTPNDRLEVNGFLRVNSLGDTGNIQLCRNASNQISYCSSSLRYKTNILPFSDGLSFINKLRPIVFDWTEGGAKDVGFGAEHIAKINPLFVTYNSQGEIEGVKYDRLSVVFVNAFKEQQAQIENQQRQIVERDELIKNLQNDFNALKTLVCSQNRAAEICRTGN